MNTFWDALFMSKVTAMSAQQTRPQLSCAARLRLLGGVGRDELLGTVRTGVREVGRKNSGSDVATAKEFDEDG